MTKSLFIWSEDLWNGERGENGDLSTAKSVFRNEVTTEELKTWPFCSLYYEEGTADDNGNTPIAFNDKTVSFDGDNLKVWTVRCSKADGGSVDFVYPDPKSVSQDFDLRSAGAAGQVHYIPAGLATEGDLSSRRGGVTFHVDEAMWMTDGSASDHREKVKDFLSKKIDEKIASADKEESSAESEVMASEYSVERVNPTIVRGEEDVHAAESFSAEVFEGHGCGCNGGECQCSDTFNANEVTAEVQDVVIDESPVDTVYPEGDGSIIGQSTYDTDFTPLGSRAEGFVNEGFASEGYFPVGEGRIIGSITSENQYEPFGYNAEDDEYYAEEDSFFPDGSGRVFGDITSTTQYTPLGYNAEGMEEYEAYDGEVAGEVQDVVIDESPMDTVYPEGDGSIIGQSTYDTDFTPLGSRAETKPRNYVMGVATAFFVGLLANVAKNMKTTEDE